MRAVLLAAGEGKRMRPLTSRRPKVMLPVAGKPLLAWTAERLVEAGVTEFLIVTHHHEKVVRDWFRTNPVTGASVRFIHQKEPHGTGHALAAVKERRPDDFLLVYGATLASVEDYRRLVAAGGPALAAFQVADARDYGALQVAGSHLRRIVEKSPRPPSRLVNAGAYRLNAAIRDEAAALRKSPRGEFELTDALNAHVKRERVKVVRFREWLEAGRPWDLLRIQETLMAGWEGVVEGAVEKGVVVHGPVSIGKGTVVKAGTYIEGPVVIGRDAKIGPRAYLRPSTSIGDGCHIGASVEIKNSLIMERTNVPHLSYVGDSVLGSDVNLGAGTSVANLKVTPSNVRVTLEDGSRIDTGRRKLGAIVGDGTKIGINCSLNVGAIVGNDCLITLGRVVSGWVKPGSRML
ncbi:MAG: NTP transferase domain-containing protein [Euryarchaeota archaeon]|nr:NTP transferase domain-containing protein [Euryarchaeota archaeon]